MRLAFTIIGAALLSMACSTENSASDASPFDGAVTDGALADASPVDATPVDATVPACQPPIIPVAPLPQPSVVATGITCIDDSDCTAVDGFCRPVSGGGSECTAFQGNGGDCGGLPAPEEQERCVPGLECDAANAQTIGTCICVPQCAGKVCGADGCGSTCGACDGVCADEGIVCNDFEADQCCFPALVTELPYVRNGRTEGAEDTFPVPSLFGSPDDPDEVIQFTPTVSGEFFFWGDCHDSAIYDACDVTATELSASACTEASLFAAAPLRITLSANQDYFIGDQEGPSANGGYAQQIHGPINVVADLVGPNISDITTDSTHVYWASGTTISRRPRDGSGNTSVIVASSGTLSKLELRGDKVYTIDSTNGLVLTAPKTGGAPTVLATEQDGVNDLTITDNYVYWTISGTPVIFGCGTNLDGAVRRVPLNGGSAEDIATGQAVVTAIDSDATHIYWTLRDGSVSEQFCAGGVRRRLHKGTTIDSFANEHSHGRVLVADGDVYVANEVERFTDGLDRLYTWYRYNKSTLVLAHTFAEIHQAADAAIDGTNFYITASDQPYLQGLVAGGIMRVSESGTSIGLVPASFFNQTHFTVSNGEVFLNYDSQIISVPTP